MAVAIAIFAIAPNASAEHHEEKMEEKPAMEATMKTPVQAVVFYSDTCGSCKILEPKMEAAMQAVNMDKINVVKFDFSNKETIEATKMLAAENNVSATLNEYGAKTGFVVLLDANGQEVAKLKKDHTEQEIAGELTSAILASL